MRRAAHGAHLPGRDNRDDAMPRSLLIAVISVCVLLAVADLGDGVGRDYDVAGRPRRGGPREPEEWTELAEVLAGFEAREGFLRAIRTYTDDVDRSLNDLVDAVGTVTLLEDRRAGREPLLAGDRFGGFVVAGDHRVDAVGDREETVVVAGILISLAVAAAGIS